ncbi:MAG: ParA family protein [Caldilinea sp. CFX5]|nr:ParA family protein [Caldilinea sp. CFX5]
MNIPTLTFFNNKSGVGKTLLVYHLGWMLAELGHRVLVCDLDPQANLTATLLTEDELVDLWVNQGKDRAPSTIYRCLQPFAEGGDLHAPQLKIITQGLALLPSDLALAGFEDQLSAAWCNSRGKANLDHPLRLLTAFGQVMQLGAQTMDADLILVDVGPNLGAINRSVLIAADTILVPLGADLGSFQGLHNLGPTIQRWRGEWQKRLAHWSQPAFPLPLGHMQALGYLVQQPGLRLRRPLQADERWSNLLPAEYRRTFLNDPQPPQGVRPVDDPYCLAILKHYRSLVALGQEARKPIFLLTVADGAIGNHALAVRDAYLDFQAIAHRILQRLASHNR